MMVSALERDIKKRNQLRPPVETLELHWLIAQLLGIEIELILPEDSTKERTQTMRAYGNGGHTDNAKEGILGSRDYADKKVAEGGYAVEPICQ
jgi:cysteine synthase B